MKDSEILKNIKSPTEFVGNKSKNLSTLFLNQPTDNLFSVPNFMVLKDKYDLDVVEDFVNKNYDGLVSVRSSGSFSTPGRMTSVLNVRSGIRNHLLRAIRDVKNSFDSGKIRTYLMTRKRMKMEHKLETEVIIQKMIAPDGNFISGVGSSFFVGKEKGLIVNCGFNVFGDSVMSGKLESSEMLNTQRMMLEFPETFNHIFKVSDFVDELFGGKQEFEFIYDIDLNEMYVLQSRTSTLKDLTNDFEIRGYKWSINGVYGSFGGYGTDLNINTKNSFELTAKGTNVMGIESAGFVSTDENDCAGRIFVTNKVLDFENVEEIVKSKGIISLRGGELSHAARIAHEFNIPTVVGITLKDENESEFMKLPYIKFDNSGFIEKLKDYPENFKQKIYKKLAEDAGQDLIKLTQKIK